MEAIFKNLPVVLPFYNEVKQQTRARENNAQGAEYKLVSPRNAILPFQIQFDMSQAAPQKWEIITQAGQSIDITNNLPKIALYTFADKKQIFYNGEALDFVYGTISEELNLPCGFYHTKFTFPDGGYLVSERFYVPENSFKVGEPGEFTAVEFWNDTDIEPVKYRGGFKQIIYLDTFVHSAVPELEEDVEKDGENNSIPTFQKLTLKYRFSDVVPDFVKIALLTLLLHDNIYLYLSDKRTGKIDRVEVNPAPDENGAFNLVDVVFEDAILTKVSCSEQEEETDISTW